MVALNPSVPPTPSPQPPSPFGMAPYVNNLALAFVLFLFIILYLFLLKIYGNRIREYDGEELPVTVEIEEPVFSCGEDGDGENECAICLSGIKGGEKCRRISTCNHVFHRDCIDRWLKVESHCPLCRTSVCVVVVPDGNTTASSLLLQPLCSEF